MDAHCLQRREGGCAYGRAPTRRTWDSCSAWTTLCSGRWSRSCPEWTLRRSASGRRRAAVLPPLAGKPLASTDPCPGRAGGPAPPFTLPPSLFQYLEFCFLLVLSITSNLMVLQGLRFSFSISQNHGQNHVRKPKKRLKVFLPHTASHLTAHSH